MEERHVAMSKVVHQLKTTFNFPLGEARALELFAGEGDRQTTVYASHVKSLEVWEIDSKHYEELRRNLPSAEIKITDTWKEIKKTQKKYDLIVVDTPQAMYGENGEYCEHFGLLPDIFRIANDNCVIILNVNVTPYNLDKQPLWKERRKEYYETSRPERLAFDAVIKHYKRVCQKNNVSLRWYLFQQRHTGFLYYFVMQIERMNK